MWLEEEEEEEVHTKFRGRKTSTGTWTVWSSAADSDGFCHLH